MLLPRITPVLLIHKGGLVKTKKFMEAKYVGDPINAVKIFNEKEADELIVLDIDASVIGARPNFTLISKLASECRMPLCYGGGIRNIEDAKKIISLGVEKVSISSSAITDVGILENLSSEIGSQSVVVTLDVKQRKSFFSKGYDVYTNNGKSNTKFDLLDVIKRVVDHGVGELCINSIDQDGMMNGYDLELCKLVRSHSNIPITFLGGAGNLSDITKLIAECGVVGAGVGSLFVFKGKFRAVLINYPDRNVKEKMFI